MDRLKLDVNGCFDPAAGGLDRAELAALAPAARAAFDGFEARRRSGELGFADLPADAAAADAAVALARELAGRFENLLVLGIGGSSLGGRAIVSALAHPFHNLLPRERRGAMRVFFPDNSDPATFEALLGTLDLAETCFATVTKSGGTAETMAQHLALRERCIARFGEEGYRERCVLVTDPAKGALRAIAGAEGLRALSVPAERRRALQRALRGRAPAGRGRRGGRRASCSPAPRRWRRAAARRRPPRTRRSCTPPRSTSSTGRRGGGSTCSCRTPTPCATRATGSSSSGRSRSGSGPTSARRRSARWARPTSTRRCSS